MVSPEVAEERRERRKQQNRLNQRARRLRVREQNNVSQTSNPYEVVRWRHAYPETVHKSGDQSIHHTIDFSYSGPYSNNTSESSSLAEAQKVDAIRPLVRAALNPSPLQNHLLNLIHFNVLRAVFSNKITMMRFVNYFQVSKKPNEPNIPYLEGVYPTRAIIGPKTNGIPESLFPTQLQRVTEHATWIDSIPFPRMRDNLIRWEGQYNHQELSEDIVGNLLDITAFYKSENVDKCHFPRPSLQGAKEEHMTDREGLIVWGEAHDPKNWEVTPGFLRKWRWALEGCQDLLTSSNRWRQDRGEKPLLGIL